MHVQKSLRVYSAGAHVYMGGAVDKRVPPQWQRRVRRRVIVSVSIA